MAELRKMVLNSCDQLVTVLRFSCHNSMGGEMISKLASPSISFRFCKLSQWRTFRQRQTRPFIFFYFNVEVQPSLAFTNLTVAISLSRTAVLVLTDLSSVQQVPVSRNSNISHSDHAAAAHRSTLSPDSINRYDCFVRFASKKLNPRS